MRLCFWLMMVVSLVGRAQHYPQDVFQSPLDIPLILSGTFGELRHNHFHAGVDFKTQGREGLSVRAAAEGYVSRVKVSPVGYGLAVYIDHPNGYTTVYGHLRSFYPELEQYVEQLQQQMESYAIDVYPEPGRLPVAQGQFIGESGNSGSSGGPHLHFEVRDTESEVPLHPLLFGFPVRDDRPPVLQTLYVYEKAAGALRPTRKIMAVEPAGAAYRIRHTSDTLLVTAPRVAFGLYTYDRANGANNRNGIYRLQMHVDDTIHYSFTMDAVPFHESRYINSHIDYCYQRQSRRRIHTCYQQPGNFLSVYDSMRNNGWLHLSPGKAVPVHFTVADPMGNSRALAFRIKYTGTTANTRIGAGEAWAPQHTHRYADSLFTCTLPAWSLYDTLQVSVWQQSTSPPVYAVGEDCVPLHYGIDVALQAAHVPERLRNKAVVIVKREGVDYWQQSFWKGDWLHANSPYFGVYRVGYDTIPPVVSVLRELKAGQRVAFRIRDAGRGIAAYRATVNGQWIKLAYDAKRALLTGRLPQPGKAEAEQIFRLEVSDGCDNLTIVEQPIK